MKILYDGLIYELQIAGGISRYFSEIIKHLPSTCTATLAVSGGDRRRFPIGENLRLAAYRKFRPGRVSVKFEKLFHHAQVLRGYDVIHPTYYGLLANRRYKNLRAPIVLTVHDMIHEIFASEIDADGSEREHKREAIEAAQIIICVSHNTKKDLLERYDIPQGRVCVIHHAAGINESMSHGAQIVPSQPYYVYVGSRASYKNFDGLLKALARVADKHQDILLCVVGSPFSLAEQNLIGELRLTERIRHYGHADDATLAKLYRCSVALAYPSLYEGFGIPPLEAMACGTTVIASDCSSLPEVIGDAGLLTTPGAVDELTDALLYLLDQPAARERLIVKGREQARKFNWQKTANQTVDAYQAARGK